MKATGTLKSPVVLVALATLASCVGEAGSWRDGWGAGAELGASGEPIGVDQALAPPVADLAAPSADGGVAPADPAATAPPEADAAPAVVDCSKWSSWTCEDIPVMVCKATCATATKTYSISCLKQGGCVCGLSTGLCGPFSYKQPCDACRQVLEQGCCADL